MGVRRTLGQIKDAINRREAEKARKKANRQPTGAAANPWKYNKKYRESGLKTASQFSSSRMTGSRGHGAQFQNPRAIRVEEVIFDYLLDEGFAYDEKSALSIMEAMSGEWVDTILEARGSGWRQTAAGYYVPRDEHPNQEAIDDAVSRRLYGSGSGSSSQSPKKPSREELRNNMRRKGTIPVRKSTGEKVFENRM